MDQGRQVVDPTMKRIYLESLQTPNFARPKLQEFEPFHSNTINEIVYGNYDQCCPFLSPFGTLDLPPSPPPDLMDTSDSDSDSESTPSDAISLD